ncbi:uncharacterized protein B0I36DRAFT_387583 [Microdochium trichocladiopsis]|uniref:Glycoside hydrolase family 79 protein n=1 Tax=Microdochium trichocladiopsis TaxID=1682393 RepID=A0A9P9BKL3_9PEZI|nr:uncharacterized protein B0I36DRAFT_387583 [Microdochium trichocladiopsis]KAH7020712.1 hypothetical protein B0I36DRAFT_387583 [Microdochium trichocladiopsis]
MEVTYGPRFFDFIALYGAETILGFNRGNNNLTDTFEAFANAKTSPGLLEHLAGVEVGNEPDVYLFIWQKPIATPPWDANQEGADSADWAQDFINSWKEPLSMLYAGSCGNATVNVAVRTWNQHLYTLSQGTNIAVEMKDARTAADLATFSVYVASAASTGREFYLGETGFHGTDVESDASFGGALQLPDKSLLATTLDINRLYYHQGTINQGCQWLAGSPRHGSSSDVKATTAKEGVAAYAGTTIGGQVFESLGIDEATGAAVVGVGASEAVIVYL